MLTAQCHCGNISLIADETPETITECNCSLCGRFGARWAYFKVSQIKINENTARNDTYRWGDGDIDFHFCPNCHCLTHYTGTGKPNEQDRFAINTRMSPDSETTSIRIRHFDGADTWAYID
ncbi:GFA family protein [Reinekea sp.]|jgi:hypothetical protein|uniref:GFA family protein n=1 Tax=Reinekea sp. TaxID=1970455 RepID=UPI003989A13F